MHLLFTDDSMESARDHWEKIYQSKKSNEVSWTEDIPSTSLTFIRSFALPKNSAIIDVGGGESKLVDFLLDEGFDDITVLDISASALNKVRERLGNRAQKVQWVVADVTAFNPAKRFDLWHDRATFHFLTSEEQIKKYVALAANAVKDHGFMTIGTFSENGPTKCSGLTIRQYTEETLAATLERSFQKITCITEDHQTPFHTTQNFLFCSFKKTSEVGIV